MADRFAVPFQVFITDGAVITCAEAGRIATAGATTLNLSTTGGAGTFTIIVASGCTGTVTSGTAAITGSVVTLAEGANVLTSDGAGTCTLNLTLGTAANTNSVNSWSATSGGVSGASVPTSADNFKADANSFTAGSQVLTVNVLNAYCLDIDWAGATDNPTLVITGGNYLKIYGNINFIAAMTLTGGYLQPEGANAQTLTTNGLLMGSQLYLFKNSGASITLQDSYTSSTIIYLDQGILDTNGYAITYAGVYRNYNRTCVVSLGNSVVNTGYWNLLNVTGFTVTANTATINISGTGVLTAGAVDYNGATFNLNGTAHTITGTPTIKELGLKPAGIQTITATGATVSLTTMIRTGLGVITIINGTFTKVLSRVTLRNMSISGSTANGGASFYAGSNSTDGGTNSGWMFREPIGAAWK
uniref:Uncharacterized protein n=1 Tax=viral metagenome TaxID=1070528 RepID=A0A6M3JTZ8_9ZZZZ